MSYEHEQGVPFFYNPDELTPAEPTELEDFDEGLSDRVLQLAVEQGAYQRYQAVEISLPLPDGDTEVRLNFEREQFFEPNGVCEIFNIIQTAPTEPDSGLDFSLIWNSDSPMVNLKSDVDSDYTDVKRAILIDELDKWLAAIPDTGGEAENNTLPIVRLALQAVRQIADGKIVDAGTLSGLVMAALDNPELAAEVTQSITASAELYNETESLYMVYEYRSNVAEGAMTNEFRKVSFSHSVLEDSGVIIEGTKYESETGFDESGPEFAQVKRELKINEGVEPLQPQADASSEMGTSVGEPESVPDSVAWFRLFSENAPVFLRSGSAFDDDSVVNAFHTHQEQMAHMKENGVFSVTVAKLRHMQGVLKRL